MVQGRIVVDSQRCKGCGLCVSACPPRLLRLSAALNAHGYHPVTLVDGGLRRCTGCAVCALVCPEVALTVYRQRKAGDVTATAAAAAAG
jgi:2-oxoglutarate ferredoxin oxidoreductase subunit delta